MSNNDEFEITEKTADAINSHLQIPTGPIRLLTIRSGLCLEIRCPGARLTGKAPKCSTILRREFGLKGRPVKLLAQFETLLQMVGVIEQGDCTTAFDGGTLRILTREEKADLDKQRAA
jgi:hypothetical protein